jgi:hypothetical protein
MEHSEEYQKIINDSILLLKHPFTEEVKKEYPDHKYLCLVRHRMYLLYEIYIIYKKDNMLHVEHIMSSGSYEDSLDTYIDCYNDLVLEVKGGVASK